MDRPRDALAEGTELAGYIVGRVLGRGGFGITYAAVDALHGDIKVAIKEFLPTGLAVREAGDVSVHPASADQAQDFAKALKRFADEARTLVALRHPNIVEAQRFIKANGTAYVVMKYEEGSSLGQRLAGGRTLSGEELRRIVPPLLDGLEAVHARSFIHRDIKPDNIYIRADGSPVLLDFGAARQAMAAERKASLTEIVTPGYAPFEQYDRHSAQGPYSDIYALGATLYRCVTGERPMEAPARVTAAARRLPDPMAPARSAARGDFPPAFLDAIDKAMAVFEHDRPQTIAEFRSLLGLDAAAAGARAVAGAGDAPAPGATLVLGDAAAGPPPSLHPKLPASAPSAATKAGRRRTAVVAAVAAIALAGGGYYAWSEYRAGLERAAALAAAEEARATAERERKRLEEERARAEAERKAAEERETRRSAEAEAAKRAEEERARAEAEAKRKAEDDARKRAEDDARKKAEDEARKRDEAKSEAEHRADQEKAEADWRVCAEEWSKEPRVAIVACTRVIERGGLSGRNIAIAHTNRAIFYNRLKQHQRAIEDCDKAIKLDPAYEVAYFSRGLAYHNLREYQRAIRDYDKAIELNPRRAIAYANRGTAYLDLGHHGSAIQDFDKAIELDPKHAQAYFNRGIAYERLGNRGAAIREYRQALRLGYEDAADSLKRLGASDE